MVNRIPDVFGHGSDASFPDDIRGTTILQIGTPVDGKLVEGGGPVIDYMPLGASEPRRLGGVLGAHIYSRTAAPPIK